LSGLAFSVDPEGYRFSWGGLKVSYSRRNWRSLFEPDLVYRAQETEPSWRNVSNSLIIKIQVAAAAILNFDKFRYDEHISTKFDGQVGTSRPDGWLKVSDNITNNCKMTFSFNIHVFDRLSDDYNF